jgi:pyruvate formate lyase activating enzyme
MTYQIYTATGCARCKITKRFMEENNISYNVDDIKADGQEVFAEFYRANRSMIYRGKDGVEFPVFTDGDVVRQGVGAVIAHLIAGDKLTGFIEQSTLHGEWIDGFNIAGGDPQNSEGLLKVLAYLKQSNLKIQVATDGHNAAVLKSVLDQNLADRVIVAVKGPANLYGPLTGTAIDESELADTIALAARFPEYQFHTTIAPLEREDGSLTYLTPQEIGESARRIETATGSRKHPYTLRIFNPQHAEDDRFKAIEPLPDNAVFKYRTAARRYMLMTEIEK